MDDSHGRFPVVGMGIQLHATFQHHVQEVCWLIFVKEIKLAGERLQV